MLQKQGADDKKNVTERLKGVWCLKAMTCDERGLVRDQVSSKGNPPLLNNWVFNRVMVNTLKPKAYRIA